MMDFSTLCWKSARPERWAVWLLALALLGLPWLARAQSAVEITQAQAVAREEGVLVNAQLRLDLPAAVEDALSKGVALYFVLQADMLRERWYWYDKRLDTVRRHWRLAYQPLTRRWRLSTAGNANFAELAYSQSFESLEAAMVSLQRVAGWKIADTAALEPGNKYRVELQWRLDLEQLPRPFQIGTLGRGEWDLSARADVPVTTPDKGK